MDQDKTYRGENTLQRCVADFEKNVILHALRRANGDTATAAQILGTTKRVLTSKIHKYAIDCSQFEPES
jgi:transcriptional regulator with GAF, ATPase, and Fis domain